MYVQSPLPPRYIPPSLKMLRFLEQKMEVMEGERMRTK